MSNDAGRFEFDTDKLVDFEQYWSEMSILPYKQKTVIKSASGKTEEQSHFNNTTIRLVRDQIGGTVFNKLQDWFDYVKDGTSFALWINRFLGFYASFDKYDLYTNDGVTATFSGSGTKHYIDENGILKEAASGSPQFPAGKYGAGWRGEEQVSNLLYRTEEFDQTPTATPPGTYTQQGWTGTNITVTADQINAPDENLTADKLYCTSAAGGNLAQVMASLRTAATVTFSVWAKVVGGTLDFSLSIYDYASGQLANDDFTATTEWQRFEVTYTSPGSGSYWGVKIHLNNNIDTLYVFGANFTSGYYARSYVKDNNIKYGDYLYFTLPANWYDRKWSLSCWFYPRWAYNEATNRRFFNWYYDTTSNWFVKLNVSGYLEAAIKYEDGSGPWTESFSDTDDIVTDEWNYLVITCDTTISNGFKFYINGVLKGTSTNSAFVPKAVNRLYVGSSGTPSEYANCIWDEICLEVNKILTQSEISARYNSNQALGIMQNYFSAVRLLNPQLESELHQGGIRHRFQCELEEVL